MINKKAKPQIKYKKIYDSFIININVIIGIIFPIKILMTIYNCRTRLSNYEYSFTQVNVIC